MQAPDVLATHAVERYRERHAPALTFDEAKQRLYTLLPRATHVEDVPAEQQEIWCLPGKILIVTKAGVVKTVLPAGATAPASRRGGRRGCR
jgi:hypothetical protein